MSRKVMQMQIDELTVGLVQTCCYILGREGGRECIVIDPGAEAARIRKAAARTEGRFRRSLNTSRRRLSSCFFLNALDGCLKR